MSLFISIMNFSDKTISMFVPLSCPVGEKLSVEYA